MAKKSRLIGLPYKLLLYLSQRAGEKFWRPISMTFLIQPGESFSNDQLRQYRIKIKDKLNYDLVRYDNEKILD